MRNRCLGRPSAQNLRPRPFLAVAALVLLLHPAAAQAQAVDSSDARFCSETSRLIASSKAPALSVAVLSRGRVIYADAGGPIETPTRRGPSPGTMYRIGSLTKLFTASIAALRPRVPHEAGNGHPARARGTSLRHPALWGG